MRLVMLLRRRGGTGVCNGLMGLMTCFGRCGLDRHYEVLASIVLRRRIWRCDVGPGNAGAGTKRKSIPRSERKFQRELPKGSCVICYFLSIP
jgi:hypothetical protein